VNKLSMPEKSIFVRKFFPEFVFEGNLLIRLD
jgi:hypothetical protein